MRDRRKEKERENRRKEKERESICYTAKPISISAFFVLRLYTSELRCVVCTQSSQ